jgi:hypothetical protein
MAMPAASIKRLHDKALWHLGQLYGQRRA